MSRFSDAGGDKSSTRSGGRRLKSAKRTPTRQTDCPTRGTRMLPASTAAYTPTAFELPCLLN
jgi:hypothetical protein